MRLSVAALLGCVLAAGCGGGGNKPLAAPSYDPEAMARAAVGQYDKNGNGALDGAELDACPGLKAALPAIDTNGDKRLSADELTARFRAYEKAGVGAVSVTCTVRLNNKPLEGATVTFTPEEFMQGKVKEASGASDATGRVELAGADGAPGLAVGVYRVSVTKAGAAIPAKYNTNTTLGFEVGPGGRGAPAADFGLTSP